MFEAKFLTTPGGESFTVADRGSIATPFTQAGTVIDHRKGNEGAGL